MVNRSPQPKTPTKEEIERAILFCVKNIKAHTESENKRMILIEESRKLELEKQLKRYPKTALDHADDSMKENKELLEKLSIDD